MAGRSRFQQKQQKRRQNGVLNIAIAIVLVAVAIVAYQLFVPDTKEQEASTDKKVAQQTTKNEKAGKSEDKEATKKKEQAEAKQKTEEEKLKAEEEKKKAEEEAKAKAEEEAKANEKAPAEKTQPRATDAYTKSSWKPVGTEQGATPAMTFKTGTADWNEMNQAISAAIDVPVEQLIIHRIGNNGKNKAYGNVQDKQSGKKYYVNIDWVDNEGWKPVLVQTLN